MIDVPAYCLDKPGVREDYPFSNDVAAFRVAGKIFALMPEGGKTGRVNLKCDPTRAIVLRQQYPDITPGYHMNKQHWNTLDLTGDLPDDVVRELVDHSYELVKPKRAIPKEHL